MQFIDYASFAELATFPGPLLERARLRRSIQEDLAKKKVISPFRKVSMGIERPSPFLPISASSVAKEIVASLLVVELLVLPSDESGSIG